MVFLSENMYGTCACIEQLCGRFVLRVVCQVCGVQGYLQHIGKNYYRVRHYDRYSNGKPVFKYHRQDPEYIYKLLEQKDNVDQTGQNVVDQNLKDKGSFNKKTRGLVDQSGMIAAFARRKPRVQIPPSPPSV